MEITSEQLESRQIKLTIVVPEERLTAARESVAREMSKREKIPGYRPGKVPYERMVALVGAEVIDERALEVAARGAVEAAVREQELQPSAPFGMEIVEREPFTISTVIPLQPEVDLGDYSSLRVPEPEVADIDDETIESTIETWRAELSFLAPVERPSEAGDVLTLGIVGKHEDSIVFEDEGLALALDSEKAADAGLPGAVVDELIGLDAGADATFDITYPEFWEQPELQGQTVSFEANIISVASVTLPEMNDALAEQLADVETLEELRAKVRETMIERAGMAQNDARVDTAVDALVASATIDYPPAMLEAEVVDILSDLRKRVEQQGFLWERWLELQKEQEGEIVGQAETEAKKRLERRLALSHFADQEEIRIDRKEVDAEIESFTAMLSTAAKRGLPGKKELRDTMGSRMLSSRVIERLLSITTGTAEETGDDKTTTIPESDAESGATESDNAESDNAE